MRPTNDIFHNPSFKKDFAFIRQLEHQNKAYQDKIWEKFVGTFNKTDDDIRIVNTRFESHPSGLSSESERSVHKVEDEDWQNEASFRLSSSSLDLKSMRERSKSGSKIVLNNAERKKLHKKLTKHLENGTMDKFEVKNIGDHSKKTSKCDSVRKTEPLPVETEQEAYLDRWSKSQSLLSTPKTRSDYSLKEEKVEVENKISNEVERKLSEEIEKLKAQLKETQKMGSKIKSKAAGRKLKSVELKGSKKLSIEINASTELRKSKHYIEKCIGVIKDICMVMSNGVTPPDGSEDYARRQVRTKEFSSRFSRIYLYPLLTQLSKLGEGEKSPSIYAKFTSLYQLAFQSFQACFSHLPNTVGTSSYQKLRELLNCSIDICEKSRLYFLKEANYDNEDYVCIFKSHCMDLSHKIEDDFLSVSMDSLLYSKSTRTSLVPTSQNNKNRRNNPDNKRSLEKRLSMYNTNLAIKKDKQWRKMLAAFEDKKPKVKSRYRTGTFKHRPPVEKISSQVTVQQKQHRLDDKRSLVLLRNTPVVTPINEDNIQTMIQYENERVEGEESEKEVLVEKDEAEVEEEHNTTFFVEPRSQISCEGVRNQEDILTKLLQLVQDTNQKNCGDTDANLTNTIMVLQKCLNFKNQKTELLKKMDNEENKQLVMEKNVMEVETDGKKMKKEPKVTVTGSKNAQLICIKDDNSVMSVAEETEKSSRDNSPEPTKKKVKSTEVQTCQSGLIEDEVITPSRSRSAIKIGRMKKPRRLLELLPKNYAINIIQYKLMFYKHHKGNYMYKKTATKKPWELMDKISEDILDYALLGIAKEIEVNELLENIYNAEFQY